MSAISLAKTTVSKKKKPVNYVDNKALYAAMSEFKIKYIAAKEAGTELPKVSEYIGSCIYKIATHLSTRPNFINYPFREELISDAIENCLTYIHNFDHVKFQNPFAYFTQTCWYAFIRRIEREKKQLYIKQKTYQNARIHGLVSNSQDGDDGNSSVGTEFESDYMDGLVTDFETKLKEKKKKKVEKNDE